MNAPIFAAVPSHGSGGLTSRDIHDNLAEAGKMNFGGQTPANTTNAYLYNLFKQGKIDRSKCGNAPYRYFKLKQDSLMDTLKIMLSEMEAAVTVVVASHTPDC